MTINAIDLMDAGLDEDCLMEILLSPFRMMVRPLICFLVNDSPVVTQSVASLLKSLELNVI